MSSLDAYLKQAGVNVGSSTKKSSLDEYLAQARPTAQTPVIQQAPVPVPKQSTLGKVGGVVKDVAKSVANTLVATPVVRTGQALQSLAGNETAGTQPVTIPGVNITVPAQKTFGQGGGTQILGQGLSAAGLLMPQATAAKMALGGALVGAGGSMEQGNSPLSAETLKQAAIGGAIGYGVGKILPKFSNVAVKTENKIAEDLASKVEAGPVQYPKTEPVYPMGEASIPVKNTVKKTGEITIPPPQETPSLRIPQAMDHLEKLGYSRGQTEAIMSKVMENNPVSKFTKSEIEKASEVMIPDNTPVISRMKQPVVSEKITPTIKTQSVVEKITPAEIRQTSEEILTNSPSLAKEYTPGKLDEWQNIVRQEELTSPGRISNVLKGIEPRNPDIPMSIYDAVARQSARLSNDVKAMQELGNNMSVEYAKSTSGAELRASQLNSKDDPITIMRKIKLNKIDQLSKETQKFLETAPKEETKKIIEEIRSGKTEPSIIKKITETLTCK